MKLPNGSEISVQQYIEEVLLFERQLEYNGNLSQILYNTTKGNNGYINTNPKDVQESLLKLKEQTSSKTSQTKSNIERKEVRK